MIVDIDHYKIQKEFVQSKFKKDQLLNGIGYFIATLACGTMVPCIVIAFWIGEITDWHPDTLSTVTRLTKFYGYTKILNIPQGSPVRSPHESPIS